MTCRCADRSTRVAVSPNCSRFTWAVVGVTPSASTGAPSSALMNALLPALNSPTMTTRKSFVELLDRAAEGLEIVWRGFEADERLAQGFEHATLVVDQLLVLGSEERVDHGGSIAWGGGTRRFRPWRGATSRPLWRVSDDASVVVRGAARPSQVQLLGARSMATARRMPMVPTGLDERVKSLEETSQLLDTCRAASIGSKRAWTMCSCRFCERERSCWWQSCHARPSATNCGRDARIRDELRGEMTPSAMTARRDTVRTRRPGGTWACCSNTPSRQMHALFDASAGRRMNGRPERRPCRRQ